MTRIPLNWKPAQRQLRQFGLIGLFVLPLVGWIGSGMPSISTWGGQSQWVMIGGASIGLLLGLLAAFRPLWLKHIFIGMALVAYPIGLVVSELLILLIYFVVFTPVALVFRLIGRDALLRKIDREATTYWTPKESSKDAESYFRQS